ncbi:MAG: SusC/RagA family TonB-linked outer membrane protein [Bacteroidales bacterium]|nr:SusC/RagA family TonB-linked outer membrane protein [Bacteroidales bacterium]
MKRFLTAVAGILFLTGLFGTPASAQNGYQVKGVVIDALGPVYGATVMEKNTTNGVSTGMDGDYSLTVSGPTAEVEVSCIGYATQVFPANAVPATITLAEDAEFLDEAVVIGYGSLSKKELSSSIVQVDKENLFKGSMNNPMEMITGKVAGLNVVTTAAANPNSGSSIQVRGATSIKAGNDPLIVIDGVPGGDIRNVTPQDIESMTVLKDAASAAIYGTRGANGVILITTKKGSGDHGKAHVSYDSYVGYNIAKDIPQVLTADEFRRSRRSATDYGASTDWYHLLLNKFSYELNQYVSVDGSSESGSYNASALYKKATGLDLTDQREEFGGRAAVEQRLLNNRFQVNFSLNARRVNETYGNDGMFDTALSMDPTMPVYNPDGSFYQPNSPTGARNPYEGMTNLTSDGHRLYLLGTAALKYNILMLDNQQLSTTVTYTMDYNDYKSNYYAPSTSGESYWGGYDGKASISYRKYQTNHLEWLFNYNLYLQDHTIQAVAGYSYEIFNYEGFGNTNYNFAYDNFTYNNIGAGTWLKDDDSPGADMWSGRTQSKLIGVFGRVNYNWKDLIMASASVRYEGSSKFGVNKKWGWFPAASIAWELANMDFIKLSGANIQSLKPRLSFGVTGRSDFDPYLSLTTYSPRGNYYMDGTWIKGYAPSNNANPDLAWERLISVNFGLDFVVLNNRLRGSIDLFNRETHDLLYDYTAPQPPFIYNTIMVNVGTTRNLGVELSLDYDVFKPTSAFQWTTGINASVGKTTLKKLSNDIYKAPYVELYQKPGVGTTEYFFRVDEGGEVGQIWGYKYAGVNEAGDLMVYDPDNNPVVAKDADPAWKGYVGSTVPKLFLSWNNTFKYKNWDLNLFFTGAFGHKIFNMRQYGMGLKGANGGGNVYRDAYTTYNYINSGGGVISDFFLYDGSYFKLQNATLGYNFNTRRWNYVDNLRLYLAAKNIYTLTRYKGSDPSLVNSNGLTPGIDTNGAYPAACQITFGVTARF